MTSSKLHAALTLSASIGTAGAPASAPSAQDDVLRFFDSCGPSLCRYVRALGIDATTSQDIVQEVFLALFHHVRLERPRDNLKGWLFKVAHNMALKHRRRLKRRHADAISDIELAELVIDPCLNPEQRLAEEQRHTRLQSVMRALPERDRQCLYLRAEGLRYREIADVLGISLGSVAKSVTRSLARFGHV